MVIVGYDPGTPPTMAVLEDGELRFFEDQNMGIQYPSKTKSGRPVMKWKSSPELIAAAVHDVAKSQPVMLIEDVYLMPLQDIASGVPFVGTKYLMLGMCVALRLRYELVPPTWRRQIGLPGKKHENANAMVRAAAVKQYPRHAASFSRVKDHNRADAAMLIHWFATR